MVESVQPRQPSQISIKTVLTVALTLVGVAALVAALWKGPACTLATPLAITHVRIVIARSMC